MRSFSFTSVVTLSSLCLIADAFPLIPRNLLQKKSPQSYSVVPVDGGSSATAPAPTQTVTSRFTQTAYTTILSTIVLTESETPVTIVVTATSATTITQVIPTAVVTAIPSVSIESVTVTASPTQPIVTSSAYDDGSWHTIYYSKWTVSTAEAAATSSKPTTSFASVSAPAITSSSVVVLTTTSAVTSASISTSVSSTKSSSTLSSTGTVTDWAKYYGTARATPVNGSWWG